MDRPPAQAQTTAGPIMDKARAARPLALTTHCQGRQWLGSDAAGGERAYEEGCVRGALISGAKLTHRLVYGEPRRREVAGFFRFRQYPQGFAHCAPMVASAERAL